MNYQYFDVLYNLVLSNMELIKCKGYVKIDLTNSYIKGTNIKIIIRDCQLD